MKNKNLVIITSILLVLTMGISFAYYVVKVNSNKMDPVTSTNEAAKPLKITFDAKTEQTKNLAIPGDKITKEFSVTIEPGTDIKTATYGIYINISENTFIYCTEENRADITNECILNAKELGYTLKDQEGNIIASGDLTGKTDKQLLKIETKTVEVTTTFNYTLEIEYIDTGYDQNHNKNATFNGDVVVELIEEASKQSFNQLAKLNPELTNQGVIDQNGFTTTEENESTGKVYETQDNDGTSYYFRGDVQDNYVKFGKTGSGDDGEDIWWRIIRINGDGSIRMIYAGTGNSDTAPDQRQASTTMINNGSTSNKFNTQYNDNMYVGFEYVSGIRNGHANNAGGGEATPSDALTILNTWFKENLEDELTAPDTKIDKNAGFCGDRSAYSGKTSDTKDNETYGVNTQVTYYGSYIRNFPIGKNPGVGNPAKPTYKCEDEANDLYTYTGSNKGTKSLTYPIGLISADEVTYAGGLYNKSNTSYYLYNSSSYWTVSPCIFSGSYATVFHMSSDDGLRDRSVDRGDGLRPVLNLMSGALTTGTGLSTDPYRVS